MSVLNMHVCPVGQSQGVVASLKPHNSGTSDSFLSGRPSSSPPPLSPAFPALPAVGAATSAYVGAPSRKFGACDILPPCACGISSALNFEKGPRTLATEDLETTLYFCIDGKLGAPCRFNIIGLACVPCKAGVAEHRPRCHNRLFIGLTAPALTFWASDVHTTPLLRAELSLAIRASMLVRCR